MTIEEYLGKSADEIEKFSDAELLEYFKDQLKITRPELAARPVKSTIRQSNEPTARDRINRAKDIAAQFGLDLDDIFERS